MSTCQILATGARPLDRFRTLDDHTSRRNLERAPAWHLQVIQFTKTFWANRVDPTIRDVAKRLKRSITTVSRALDGYEDVAEDTRIHVVKTAQEMGYEANRAARQPRRQRTDIIGYAIPYSSAGFADSYFGEVLAGMGDEASAQNRDLLVTAAPPASPAEKAQYERWIQGGRVDGMVVNRVCVDDWRLEYLDEACVPHVSLEQSSGQIDFVGVEVDALVGYLDLIAHLVNRGHTHVGRIGGQPEIKIEYERHVAYQMALKSVGILPDPDLVTHADLTAEGEYRAPEHLLALANPPTANVCVNDLTAIGAMHASHKHGLRVGHEVAIAGIYGIADAAHTEPPLTTLDQPVYDIARQLVSMLLALIGGGPLKERKVRIFPGLLIGESTTG